MNVRRRSVVAFLALAALAAASWAGHAYLESLIYYPVVRVDLPYGLSVTAVLREAKEPQACARTNERFLTPFRKCEGCKVVSVRCERKLDGLELALHDGTPVAHHTVVGASARVAFRGPADLAKASCQAAAAEMIAKGVKSAVCLLPQQQAARPEPR